MNTFLWIVQILLAVLYVTAGGLKAFGTSKAREQMPWAGRHTVNFVRNIGFAELLGAVGLILPMLTGILPWLTPVAALGLVLVQGLAIFTEHLPNNEYQALPFNLALLLLAAFISYCRFFILPA
jgi:uncharacterized membrane protein YphA (DoxX/SURF4 family)